MKGKTPYIKLFAITSIIFIIISSNNFYNLTHGYKQQKNANINTNITKQSDNKSSNSVSVPKLTIEKNITDERALAFNQSKQNGDIETKMSSGELMSPSSSLSNGTTTNLQGYINQLSNSTSDDIATFPINDLSQETIVALLKALSVQSLYKVLNSITVDDLSTLLNTNLTHEQANGILDRLPPNQKIEIQNRLVSK
jgi:hypothetical protein